MQNINFTKPRLHLFICVNDRSKTNGKPSCCQYITEEDFRKIKSWLIKEGLSSTIYCTKTGCLGFCPSKEDRGGVSVIYPSGRFVKNIQGVDELKKLIIEGINKL
jgi:hypothetical protein